MILRSILVPAGLATAMVLALGAISVSSQPAADEPAPAATTEQPPANDSATGGERPANTDKSPSDYRASEQISEDLSVSFPVDI